MANRKPKKTLKPVTAKAAKFPARPKGMPKPTLAKTDLFTYVINNVPAAEVAQLVAGEKTNPKYVTHSIHEEPDREFTVVFIYRKNG